MGEVLKFAIQGGDDSHPAVRQLVDSGLAEIVGHDDGADFVISVSDKDHVSKKSKFGTWSFEADYSEENVCTLRLISIGENGGRFLLKEGFFRTVRHSSTENRDRLILGGAEWPVLVCREIQNGKTQWPSYNCETQSTPQKSSKWLYDLHSLFFEDVWEVGVAKGKMSEILSGNAKDLEFSWVRNPSKSRYLADPFATRIDGETTVFVEDCDIPTGFGKISKVKFDESVKFGSVDPVESLKSDHHQSYPYVFEHSGETYCITEKSGAGSVDLQVWDSSTKCFVFKKTLVGGFKGVDSSICFFNDRWWIFTCNADNFDHTKLYIFWCDELLGEWKPHTSNPVKCDVRSSRPGGTPFVVDGVLYRPTQDCSARYGGQVAITRVSELSPDVFSEEVVTNLDSQDIGIYGVGLHTLSEFEDMILVDVCRERFTLNKYLARWKRRFQRVFGRT